MTKGDKARDGRNSVICGLYNRRDLYERESRQPTPPLFPPTIEPFVVSTCIGGAKQSRHEPEVTLSPDPCARARRGS
jgi:hypothetical protein